jgi:hypothetical protein
VLLREREWHALWLNLPGFLVFWAVGDSGLFSLLVLRRSFFGLGAVLGGLRLRGKLRI